MPVTDPHTRLAMEEMRTAALQKALMELAVEFIGKDRSRFQLLREVIGRGAAHADLRPSTYATGPQRSSIDFQLLNEQGADYALTPLREIIEKIGSRIR